MSLNKTFADAFAIQNQTKTKKTPDKSRARLANNNVPQHKHNKIRVEFQMVSSAAYNNKR